MSSWTHSSQNSFWAAVAVLVKQNREMPGQFIIYIHAEHTTADHGTDKANFLTRDKQDLRRNNFKTAPINTASELIKTVSVQDQKSIPGSKIL